jgi:DNA-binding NtrC family response regulator
VLVVDDDPAARLSVETLLSDEFDVVVARDGREAANRLDADAFDVVLTDYQMPHVSGLELVGRIQSRHPATVVILLTANAAYPEIRDAQREWRTLRVLIKPYDPQLLLSIVRNASVIAGLRRAIDKLDRTRKV